MGKIIYTERDVELLAARGIREIPVNDDVILTGVAREKIEKLGMKYRFVPPGEASAVGIGVAPVHSPAGSETVSARPVDTSSRPDADRERLVEQAMAAVIARLGPQVDTEVVERAVRAVVNRMHSDSA